MMAQWTVTENAAWDYTITYSYIDPAAGNKISYSAISSIANMSVIDLPENTIATVYQTTAQQSTYYTTDTRTVGVSIISTETVFVTDPEDPFFSELTSASWNDEFNTIDIYTIPTTLTVGVFGLGERKEIYLKSFGTYLHPLPLFYIPSPTVYEWKSCAGYSVPTNSDVNNTYPSYDGRYTLYPDSKTIQASIFCNPSAKLTETLYSESLTWTEQINSAIQTTSAAPLQNQSIDLTFSTATGLVNVNTTITTSSYFIKSYTYGNAQTHTFSEFFNKAVLAATTFAIGRTTTSGSTTVSSFLSSSVKKEIDMYSYIVLISNFDGGVTYPIGFLETQITGRKLTYGSFSSYAAANAGHALLATEEGGVALSHVGDSFELPPAPFWFEKASWQNGVFAIIPFETRSYSSENSSTYWSLGPSQISITTKTKNSETTEQTSSVYSIKTVEPTAWSASSTSAIFKFTDQRRHNSTLAFPVGGNYPTHTCVTAGGLVSATCGSSSFSTSGTIDISNDITAFSPLPFFIPITSQNPIETYQNTIPIKYGGFQLPTMGGILTA